MTEKQLCSNCKHLEHDGMAGIWCSVHGNNKNYDCPKFEYNCKRFIAVSDDLIKDNKYDSLKNNVFVADMLNCLIEENKELKEENEYLKIRFKEERDTAMRLGSQCDTLTIQNQELKDKYNEQSVSYEGLEEQVERLLDFKDKVFNLINAKIKLYSHKPVSAPISQPMSVNFDADVDRLARLSELEALKKELTR